MVVSSICTFKALPTVYAVRLACSAMGTKLSFQLQHVREVLLSAARTLSIKEGHWVRLGDLLL